MVPISPQDMDENLTIEQLKYQIKKWELAFSVEHGKKPNKDDISDAPDDIKDSYRNYWKLKKVEKPKSCDSEKMDDVWSPELNKCYQNTKKQNLRGTNVLQKFTEKLKHQPEGNNYKEFRKLNVQRKNGTISPDKTFDTSKMVATLEKSSQQNFAECTSTTSCNFDETNQETKHFTTEISTQRHLKIIKSPSSYKTMKNVSVLSPLSDLQRNKCGKMVVTSEESSQQNLADCNFDETNQYLKHFTTEISTPRRLKIIKSPSSYKNIKNVSVLSPLTDLQSIKRLKHFQTNVNRNWLERCSLNDFKTSEKSSEVSQFSEVKNKDNNFESYIHISGNSNKQSSNEDSNKPLVNNEDLPTDLEKKESQLIERHEEENSNCSFVDTLDAPNFKMAHKRLSTMNKSCNQRIPPNETKGQKRFRTDDESEIGNQMKEAVKVTDENHITSTRVFTKIQESDSQKMPDMSTEIVKLPSKKKKKLSETEEASNSLDEKSYSVTNKKLTSHLARKIASGTVNENYVRVNIKKKSFSRGHHRVNVKKMKWQKWKQLKKEGSNQLKSVSATACFKCGEIGHWARNCPSSKGTTLLPECEEADDLPLPTLEEAAELAKGIKPSNHRSFETTTVKIYEDASAKPSDLYSNDISDLEAIFEQENDIDYPEEIVSPLYSVVSEENLIDTPKEVFEGLNKMGYSEFRQGQEKAIMRILTGLSTLVVLPTGSGKSLCYQLPAYLYAQKYACITLVVSPLVSLMEDQVTGLPSCIHAVCLHSGMTEAQKKNALEAISSRKAQILLVSPEAVIGGRRHGKGCLPANLPPIAFACVDEAHCLSEWSHNFRPSYLQLYKVLTKKLGVRCILGLTATATQTTSSNIVSLLDLKNSDESVIGNTNVPSNLHLSVSRDKDKDWALIKLLKGDRFSRCSSIIIYCIRRDETERLATVIRTCLQDEEDHSAVDKTEKPLKKKVKPKKGRILAWTAEAYNAGLTPSKRRSVQKNFMSGKLRVVIATIAFGMGLDKSDVRAIIHYNMPKSFESYVQEIGRAGRDGLDAQCHLFLDSEGKDLCELRRHIFSNSIDRYTVRKLLQKIFVPCKCVKLQQIIEESSESVEENVSNGNAEASENSKIVCPKHEIAFSVDKTVQELDLKEESISTLLCYLELHPKQWIEQLPPGYATCTIRCYGGSKQMRSLIQKCPPIAVAMALDRKAGKEWDKSANYQFQVIDIASHMGWSSPALKRELKRLEWNGQKKTGVLVELSDLAFHLRSPGNLCDDELDSVLDFLYNKTVTQEQAELQKLQELFHTFQRFSFSHYWSCCDDVDLNKSDAIKDKIKQYFENSVKKTCIFETIIPEEVESKEVTEKSPTGVENNNIVAIEEVRRYVNDIICTNHDQNFNGRAIARIFHGITSPCYPAEIWGRVGKFWRCLLNVDFNVILNIGNEELRKMR